MSGVRKLAFLLALACWLAGMAIPLAQSNSFTFLLPSATNCRDSVETNTSVRDSVATSSAASDFHTKPRSISQFVQTLDIERWGHSLARILLTNLVVAILILLTGFFTSGFASATILVWNGHLLGLQLVRASAREIPFMDIVWLTVPHCIPEVIAFAWAGSVGFRGVLPITNFLRGQPVRFQHLIPSKTEIGGIISLLIFAASLEATEIVLVVPE